MVQRLGVALGAFLGLVQWHHAPELCGSGAPKDINNSMVLGEAHRLISETLVRALACDSMHV